MFKRGWAFLLIPVVLTTFFMGCSSGMAASSRPKEKPLIGFSMDTLKEERWYKDQIGFVDEIKKQGADVLVSIDYDDAQKQIEQVKQMVSKGISVLVIIPHDAKSAAAAVNYAKQNGVKVIAYDRLVLNADIDLYISFDNMKVGELQAQAVFVNQKVDQALT